MPYHIAMELLFTGRWIDAEEAHRFGLVNEVLAANALMERVWEVARLLANGPPLVFAAIKEVARESQSMTFQDAMNRITRRKFRSVDTLYASEDQMEGFRAFADGPGRALHDATNEAAFDAGVFGVPTYLVGDEMWFGREHLPRVEWLLGGAAGPAPDVANRSFDP